VRCLASNEALTVIVKSFDSQLSLDLVQILGKSENNFLCSYISIVPDLVLVKIYQENLKFSLIVSND
jgi:hypothetical protein